MVEYIFPGSVLFLKLVFRIFVDQKFKWGIAVKSLYIFPLDLAFLSLSFGAVAMSHATLTAGEKGNIKTVIASTVICVILLLIITPIARAAGDAVDDSRWWPAAWLCMSGYFLSFIILFGSLNIGAMV